MPLYEHVFLARQDISASQTEGLVDTFKKIIEDKSGSVAKTEYWGLRSLAYKIKKSRKAHYALMNIDAPHEAVAEMERQMKLNDDVIRFITLRVDELETEPSIQMKVKTSRDERRADRDDFKGSDDKKAASEAAVEEAAPVAEEAPAEEATSEEGDA